MICTLLPIRRHDGEPGAAEPLLEERLLLRAGHDALRVVDGLAVGRGHLLVAVLPQVEHREVGERAEAQPAVDAASPRRARPGRRMASTRRSLVADVAAREVVALGSAGGSARPRARCRW
jgi:hypothetical protein